MPLTLSQIPEGDNYGLLSGPHSGVIAIDFDGAWAFNWWISTFPNLPLPDTIAWTSGRPDRIQFAFTVPEEYWGQIQTIKFNNGQKKPHLEGIEFRWAGCQSVLPPSIHPDTGMPYVWVGVEEAAELPDEVLQFLISKCAPHKPATQSTPPQAVSGNSPKLAELHKVMLEFNKHYPSLSYDDWRDTTWACITHVGHNPGIAVMMTFYPEQVAGEYEKLARSYSSSSAPGIGSLIHKVQDKDPAWRPVPKYKDLELVENLLRRLKK